MFWLVVGYWLLVVSDRYVIEYQPTTYNKQPTTKKAAFADGLFGCDVAQIYCGNKT